MDIIETQRQMAHRGLSSTKSDASLSTSWQDSKDPRLVTKKRETTASTTQQRAVASAASVSFLDRTKSNIRSRVRTAVATASSSPRRPMFHLRRVRSRSVDEIMLARLQRSTTTGSHRRLLEDHYRVSRTIHNPRKLVVLPGVPTHGEDWDRDSHDFFNLVVLVPVVVLNIMCWNWDMLLYSKNNKHNSKFDLSKAWTGDWFGWFFGVTLLYFIVDLIWIVLIPTCVKSPSTIIHHHLATVLYLLIPFYHSEFQWCMGACMIVEINTWFLIARRVFNKQGFPPWILKLSGISIRVKVISIFFYLTWISIRCFLYPYLLIEFWKAWWTHSQKVGSKINLILLTIPLHALFCILNLRWTYDLLMSKIRYWRRCTNSNKNGSSNKAIMDHPDKGL